MHVLWFSHLGERAYVHCLWCRSVLEDGVIVENQLRNSELQLTRFDLDACPVATT